MHASASFTPATVARVADRESYTGSDRRDASVSFDGLTIHVGHAIGLASDEDIVASGELLIAAVRQLVDAARQRIADDEPSEPDGPPDSYWENGGPATSSPAYRRDMRDAGRAVA